MTGGGPRVDVDDRRSATTGAGAAADPGDLAALLSAVLAAEGVGPGAEVGLHLVDPAAIAALNAEHLGGDGPTDVLSFPLDGRDDPGSPPWMVGDVVVCPEVADAQAAGHAGTAADELRLLVVHGGLHLCGWDHATREDQRAMWDRERQVMAALGVSPTGDPWAAP